MKAAFKTEGKTTTQSALSSKSWGMSSGTLRISVITLPASLTRSSSFASLSADVLKAITNIANVIDAKKLFHFMCPPTASQVWQRDDQYKATWLCHRA